MSIFKLMFSGKFKNFRDSLNEIDNTAFNAKNFTAEYENDQFLDKLTFFSNLFYTHGFLVSRNQPAFGNAYKNISEDVLRKTYIALPVYFAFRHGIENTKFTTIDELKNVLSKLYPKLDLNTLDHLLTTWHNIKSNELEKKLYEHFAQFNIFDKVFVQDANIEKWFKDFLNQSYDFSIQSS